MPRHKGRTVEAGVEDGYIPATGQRAEFNAMWDAINGLVYWLMFAVQQDPGIGNGTTAGRLRTNAAVDFKIAGFTYNKASTDDLWDLSGEVDTGAGVYRAYWLELDSAGAASFVRPWAGRRRGETNVFMGRLTDQIRDLFQDQVDDHVDEYRESRQTF